MSETGEQSRSTGSGASSERVKPTPHDVVVIGGGQAGLAVGYYLRRSGLSHVILDAQPGPGGSWRHVWDSLALFSPAKWSSLPGWIMPGGASIYPDRDAVLDYFAEYERRYQLPVKRPVSVRAVTVRGNELYVRSSVGDWPARVVVSATGNWTRPFVPHYEGQVLFSGTQIHSAHYRSPAPFAGKSVLIVGGGNSGAQILAEVSRVARAVWVTPKEPRYMPDDVDGRVLFDAATSRYLAQQQGRDPEETAPRGLGDIVMVPPVKEARERGVLKSVRPFKRLTPSGVIWPDGSEEHFDVVIWCTGFRAALDHLAPLGVLDEHGRIEMLGTRSVKEPRLWLVGYGEWTGYASATLIGVGRTARSTVDEITQFLAD